jgi:aryl-alcohol dehydrogenase-like predicted oxidoreductase
VIARVPLDEGGLTGRIGPETDFPAGDWRNNYFRGDRKQQVHDRVTEIAADCGRELADMPELALRFCLSAPAVSSVAVGMRTKAHVAANAAVSDGAQLDAAQRERLRAHRWVRDFYSGSHQPPTAV